MQQGKRLSCAVEFGSPFDLESEVAIERHSRFILFVHIDGCRAQFNDRMFGQPSSDTRTMKRGMNEQRFHLLSRDTDKTNKAALGITDAVEMIESKKPLQHQRLEELNVGLRQEMVRRSDRCLPDFEDSIAFFSLDAVHPVLKHYLPHAPAGK